MSDIVSVITVSIWEKRSLCFVCYCSRRTPSDYCIKLPDSAQCTSGAGVSHCKESINRKKRRLLLTFATGADDTHIQLHAGISFSISELGYIDLHHWVLVVCLEMHHSSLTFTRPCWSCCYKYGFQQGFFQV